MVRIRRSVLFAPADRPERVAKAATLPADVVVVELEDGVAPERKALARDEAGRALAAVDFGAREVVVRVNRIATLHGLADLLALATWPRKPDVIMVPKCESAAEVQVYAALLAEMGAPCEIWAVIESGKGLQAAAAIAAASPRVGALVFGGADLSADLGCRFAWEPLLAHRAAVIAAGASAGVPVIDVPFTDIKDEAGLVAETQRSRDLGMVGKVCIHPSQLAPVNVAFTPTPQELERAQRIVAAAGSQGTGAILVDGRMVDGPLVKLAHQIVAIAERVGLTQGA